MPFGFSTAPGARAAAATGGGRVAAAPAGRAAATIRAGGGKTSTAGVGAGRAAFFVVSSGSTGGRRMASLRGRRGVRTGQRLDEAQELQQWTRLGMSSRITGYHLLLCQSSPPWIDGQWTSGGLEGVDPRDDETAQLHELTSAAPPPLPWKQIGEGEWSGMTRVSRWINNIY
jgi:hypothetical protein